MDLEALLDEADAALAAGDADAALATVNRGLSQSPKHLELRALKAECLGALGQAEEAAFEWTGLVAEAPKEPRFLLGAANLLVRQNDEDPDALEEALDLLGRAQKLVKKNPDLEVEVLLLEGMALSQLGEPGRALGPLELALSKSPADHEVRLELGLAQFECGQIDAAFATLEALRRAAPELAEVHHVLGLVHERRGEHPKAHESFARATSLDGEGFPAPTTLSEQAFDQALEEAIEQLPPHAREHLGNVTIAVEPIPDVDDLDGGRLSPTMLGIFQGTPIDERSVTASGDHQTARIKLFQKNLERFARSREELVEQIGITLLHEVGHLLGLDEDELRERGLD